MTHSIARNNVAWLLRELGIPFDLHRGRPPALSAEAQRTVLLQASRGVSDRRLGCLFGVSAFTIARIRTQAGIKPRKILTLPVPRGT